MDYREKSELKNEITKSTKRSIKTCVLLSIVILAFEAFICGVLYLVLREHESLGTIATYVWLLLMLRSLQGMFINFYEND